MSISNVHPKISREFSLRLDQLRPRDKVRAIVMLRPESNGAGNAISGARRPTRADRQSKAEKISQSAESALPEIDEILEKFNGQRLAEHPNALGAIPVETTADGVIALAEAECVKTIMEDQPILPPFSGSDI
jgi:hypothetical protein